MIVINKNEWPFTTAQNLYCKYSTMSTTLSLSGTLNGGHFSLVYGIGLQPKKRPAKRAWSIQFYFIDLAQIIGINRRNPDLIEPRFQVPLKLLLRLYRPSVHRLGPYPVAPLLFHRQLPQPY